MLIPLSWLKEYVDIKIPFPELAAKLSEAGLTVEKWQEKDGDIIFDPEVTPNRPDWLSVFGVAREIAAVTNSKLKTPDNNVSIPAKIKNPLEINIKSNNEIVPRITSVVIRGVQVKSSPPWLQKRIKEIGLRPINNLVDITNYVLWLYGNALHVFDYDKIRGKQMTVELSKSGEPFRSLDGIDYTLPSGAIIIKDVGRVIDLVPLKGGDNTAVSAETQNVLLHSIVCHPGFVRKVSQSLNLRSDSSAIAERGMDPNGTLIALKHSLKLILELAGGEIASPLMDTKKSEFLPNELELNHEHLESVIGIKFNQKEVGQIFERLNLPVINKSGSYKVTVPTFRHDLKAEEDLVEEVARIYGYDKLPKTLPVAPPPATTVAYMRDYDLEYEVKRKMTAFGYSEIYTYSLIAEKQLVNLGIDPNKTLRIDNPISRDFEYLRPNIFGNLLDALKQNIPNFPEVKLFELGKRYSGENLDKIKEEYWIWAGETGEKFFEAKGNVEALFDSLGIDCTIRPATPKDNHYWLHPGRTAHIETEKGEYLGVIGEVHPSLLSKWGIKQKVTALGINYDLLIKNSNSTKKYQPIPKYPAVIEDLSLIVPTNTLVGDIITTIKKSSSLVNSIELLDIHENSTTFRISYLDRTKNLTEKEVGELQNKIVRSLKEKLGIKIK